jgi:two-component system phosphate regulon sensor histidine kinase PhoR
MHRLEALVTRLIDLSKLEAGRDAFEHEPLSVSAVIDDAIAALEAATLGDKVNVTTEIEPDLRVVGDRFALAQAVTNLLVNAYKYTGPDKRIELFARTLGKNVELAVADNGPGIPRSEQKQIFERFERGRAAVDEGKEGSGLGLSIVSAIARAHNGTVLVRSDSRSGSRFSILLPRAA